MSQKSGQHDQQHLDCVFLYALRTLPSNEAADVEECIAACAECRQELEALGPIVGSFASWPTDVLRPSRLLWDRLVERIAAETGRKPVAAPVSAQLSPTPEWEEAAPGIFVKLLAADAENDNVSMLVRLAPGADYPSHRHAGIEELHLLHGELMVNDRKLFPGDYIRTEAGTVDHRVWSETGCTCFLMTSTQDEIL
jgi:quercetin dioxygenase-like cupin family protein